MPLFFLKFFYRFAFSYQKTKQKQNNSIVEKELVRELSEEIATLFL